MNSEQFNNWFSPFQTPNFQQPVYQQPNNQYEDHNIHFDEEEMQRMLMPDNGTSKLAAMRPCMYLFSWELLTCRYCGEESYLECNHCAKMGLATFFCSPEHQSLVWKDHLEYHKQSLNPYQPPSNK